MRWGRRQQPPPPYLIGTNYGRKATERSLTYWVLALVIFVLLHIIAYALDQIFPPHPVFEDRGEGFRLAISPATPYPGQKITITLIYETGEELSEIPCGWYLLERWDRKLKLWGPTHFLTSVGASEEAVPYHKGVHSLFIDVLSTCGTNPITVRLPLFLPPGRRSGDGLEGGNPPAGPEQGMSHPGYGRPAIPASSDMQVELKLTLNRNGLTRAASAASYTAWWQRCFNPKVLPSGKWGIYPLH